MRTTYLRTWWSAATALLAFSLLLGCSPQERRNPSETGRAASAVADGDVPVVRGASPPHSVVRGSPTPHRARPQVSHRATRPAVGRAAGAQTRADPPSNSTGITLTDVTGSSRIAFRHTDGASGRKYIVETVVAGLATLDYDGDGRIDLYFLNGAPLPGASAKKPPRNALYRNRGDGTFTDVTQAAGVGDTGYGLGVVAADFDNDGDQDLYVNNFGPNVLYVNNGDGTFQTASDQAGVAMGEHVGAGAVFLDMEADGDLDLYVGNYVDFAFDRHLTRKIGDYEFPPGPQDYPPAADCLFQNEGDGHFTDVSQARGIGGSPAPSMGIVSADFDDDGDADIFVCSDNAANLLFQNDGAGNFQEVALVAGVAHDLLGNDNGNMGVECADYDNDGRLDLFVTTYQGELAILFRNLGGGFFQDVTRLAGVGASSFPHVKWGVTLADFDHDADRDAFIACGHFMENVRYIDDRTDVRVPNFLLANQGDGKFIDVSSQAGSGLAIVACSKGAAFDDLDNDGDLDVVILNANASPSLLRNDTPATRRSVQIRLCGTRSNRDGVGARVKVHAGGGVQTAEVHAGRGYQSHYGAQLHFGLGDATQVDRIEVRWLGGDVQTIENPPPAQLLLITEGQGCESLDRK